MNANVGIFDSPKRRKTSCPSFPNATDWLRSDKKDIPERSAPAAKINGLPVIAIAEGLRPIASVMASFKAFRESAPKVFGRLWSWPLSKVMSAIVPLPPKADRSISRTSALVTTSSGAPAGSVISALIIT